MKITIRIEGIKITMPIPDEEAAVAFAKVFKERGYIVIGMTQGSYEIGRIIHQVFHYHTRRGFQVIAETNRKDLEDQLKLMEKHNPGWRRTGRSIQCVHYYRIVPHVSQKKIKARRLRLPG